MNDKFQTIKKLNTDYLKNLVVYSDYNDSLYSISDFSKWKKNLIKRSKTIRKMFKQNELIIGKLYELLEMDLDDEIAQKLFDTLKKCNDNDIHDAGIMIKIINKLINYYEKNNDYEKLIPLYVLGALEEMEFYLRMDNESTIVNPLAKYKNVLALKDKYNQFKNPYARRCFFIIYYNLIGPLADLKKDVRKDFIKYYKEAKEFYNSDIVQSIDKNNPDIADEMHLINEVFITGFSYFINNESLNDKEYFELIYSIIDEEEIDDNQRRLIDLVYSYSKEEIDYQGMIEKLFDIYKSIHKPGFKYERNDNNINDFCEMFDISEMILTLLKKPGVDVNLKYKYVNVIGNNLINYIKTVPYRDYTSYFDDVSADVYKYLLPFYEDFDEKCSLLNSLILRRQPITYIHSIMVKNITILIANELLRDNKGIFKDLIDMGYKKDDDILYYLTNAALYHDIGKCLTVGVINLQNRKLSEDEFNYIKLHPSKSKLLIGDDKDFLKYYDVMIGHHKTYDGNGGYPSDFDNTKSKYKIAIDLITIADTIDAATDVLGRNYASGKSFKKVLDELIELKGTRYNPFLVDFIANNAKLKKELDDLTGKDRVNVYFDVYKTIIYS